MKQYILASALLLSTIAHPFQGASIMEKWNQQKKHLRGSIIISLLTGISAGFCILDRGSNGEAARQVFIGISAAMLWALLISNQDSQCDFSSIAIAGACPAAFLMSLALALKVITRHIT